MSEKTLRDEIAIVALGGLLAAMPEDQWVDVVGGVLGGKRVSAAAYTIADAMMARREKPTP